MIDYKRVLFTLMRGANRRRKLALDEGEIIGWATHEDGQHYPIHAAQGGGGGSSGASSGGASGGSKKSAREEKETNKYAVGSKVQTNDIPQSIINQKLSESQKYILNTNANEEATVIKETEKAVLLNVGTRKYGEIKLWVPKSAMGRDRQEQQNLSTKIQEINKKWGGKSGFSRKVWTKGDISRIYYKVNGKDAGYLDNRGNYIPGEINLEQ